MIVLSYSTNRIKRLLPNDPEANSIILVLKKLLLLYSLTCLEKHLDSFYQGKDSKFIALFCADERRRVQLLMVSLSLGGYCTGPEMADKLKQNILDLCTQLKPDAIAIADALSPPDFVLNSSLGSADGKVLFFLNILLEECLSENLYMKLSFRFMNVLRKLSDAVLRERKEQRGGMNLQKLQRNHLKYLSRNFDISLFISELRDIFYLQQFARISKSCKSGKCKTIKYNRSKH